MVSPMKKTVALWITFAVVLVATAVAPEAAAQGLAPDYYGTADTNYLYISGEEFRLSAGDFYYWAGDGFWAAASGLQPADPSWSLFWNIAPLHLPSGALVDGYTVIYDDSHAVEDLELVLSRYWVGAFGATGTAQIGLVFSSTGAPGVRSTWVNLDPDVTIRYYISATLSTQSYAFTVSLPDTVDVRFRGVIVHWKRQISPAPAVQSFPDVAPGYWAFQSIEALAASEITTGFPDGTFRPTAPVTRAQMATFLARALGLHWSP